MFFKLFQGSMISFVIGLGNLILLARLLPPESIGVIKLAQLYSGIFSVLSTLQIHSGLLLFKKDFDKEQTINAIVILVLSAITISVIPVVIILFSQNVINNYGLFGLYLYTFSNALVLASPSIFSIYSKGAEYVQLVTLFMLSSTLSIIVSYFINSNINVYLNLWGGAALIIVLSSYWKNIFFSMIEMYFLEKKSFKTPERVLFSYSIKLSLSLVTESFYQKVDKLYASYVLTTTLFGRYSVVCFENPLVGMVLSTAGVALVNKSKYTEDKLLFFKDDWTEKINFTTLLILSTSLFMFVFSKELIGLAFGYEYQSFSIVLSIYSFVSTYRYAPFQVLLRLEKRADLIFKAALISLCSTVITACVLFLNDVNKIIFIALIYALGWFVFNVLVVLFYNRLTGVSFQNILCFKQYLHKLLLFIIPLMFLKIIQDLGGVSFYIIILLYITYFITLVFFKFKAHVLSMIGR